jgi:hypothetical protein
VVEMSGMDIQHGLGCFTKTNLLGGVLFLRIFLGKSVGVL